MASQVAGSQTTEATQRKHRLALPSLHGMRFVAATSVVFVHASLELPYTNQLVGGFLLFGLLPIAAAAVSYFFLLSGFVNTWTWQSTDTARTFYWRRFSRFLPSYYVIFIISVLLMLTVGPRVGLLPTLAQGLLIQSWVPSQGYIDVLNSLSWSLSVEFFCYLLLPFIIRWVRSIRPERLWHWVIGLIAVIIALPFISNVLMPTQPPHPLGGQSLLSFLGAYFSTSHQLHNWDSASFPQVWLVYHFPLARIPDFLLGVFMARIIQTDRWIGISRRTCIFILVPALIGAMFVPFLYELNSVTIVPMVLLLGAIAFADDNRKPSLLAKKPMVFMGGLTYSIYLVHGLILTYGHMLFGTTPTPFGPQEKSWGVVGGTAFLVGNYVISLGVAWLLYRCVEVPATLHLSHRRRSATAVISEDLKSPPIEPASRDPAPTDLVREGEEA